MPQHRCLTCGKAITWRFAICSDCERTYGTRSVLWPSWLRYFWSSIQKERRENRRYTDFCIPYEEDEDKVTI